MIDAKHYTGQVQQRDVGRWLKADRRLYVGGRDRTKAVEGLGWQVDAVRKAIAGVQPSTAAEVPLHAALCFIEAEWKFFPKPFFRGGVWVIWPKKLIEMIGAPGPLGPDDVKACAGYLSKFLPPMAG